MEKYVTVSKIERVKCPPCARYVTSPHVNEVVSVTDFKINRGIKWFRVKGYESCCCCGLTKWINSSFFRPLDDVLSEISLEEVEEVLNTELVEV